MRKHTTFQILVSEKTSEGGEQKYRLGDASHWSKQISLADKKFQLYAAGYHTRMLE